MPFLWDHCPRDESLNNGLLLASSCIRWKSLKKFVTLYIGSHFHIRISSGVFRLVVEYAKNYVKKIRIPINLNQLTNEAYKIVPLINAKTAATRTRSI